MAETHYYIISGLGADYRAFEKLHLPKNHTHLAWIPNHTEESLSSYANRMAENIVHSNPIIIGLSFGGIIAQEIAAQLKVKSLILISTITNHYEKPFHFRLAHTLNLLNIIPKFFFNKVNFASYWMFSLKSKEEKALLDYFHSICNPDHLLWAAKEILRWKGAEFTCDFVQIHSSGDRIFPIRNVSNGITVNGGHFAVYSNAEEIDQVLIEELAF